VAHFPIRTLLDDLNAEAINRLCELRHLGGRGLNARREALARSYRGDHSAFLDDLRVKDLSRLMRGTWEIDGTEYFLPEVSSYSGDALIRIARKAFCRDGVPSEFLDLEDDENEGGEDEDEDQDDEDQDEDEGQGEEDEDESWGIDHRGSEHAQWLLRELSYVAREAAEKEAHDYQREAEATLLRLLGPQQPQLLHLATGGGKTLVANNVIVRWLERHGGPVLWVTKDWRLLFQAARDLRRRHQNVPLPTRLGGDGRILHPLIEGTSSGIVYTTIHTLARRLDESALRAIGPSLLVWDECHWGEHSGTGKILTASSRNGIPVLGLTATPRHDTRYNVAFSRTYRHLVTEGYLSKEIVYEVATGTEWSPEVQRLGDRRFGDVTQASLKDLAKDRRRNDLIIRQFLNNQQRYGKTIVFACTVEHATRLAELFSAQGIAARPVHHHQGEGEIHGALDMFRTGQVQVLVNIAMLTHGIDVPDARTVFLCRPTTSDILFAQMIGRACRRDEASGKTTFNVVEFTDNVHTHSDVLFKSANVFFQGAGSGRPDDSPRSTPMSGARPREHAFDPTGAPTWMPIRDDVPESLRGLWYRERQTFGVEIELTAEGRVPTDPDREWHEIAEKLRLRLSHAVLGRVAPSVTAEYQGSAGDKDTSVWNVEFDASTGWEVTSRILSDYNGFAEVDDVCRALDLAATELGLVVNYRTGLHIHIGWLSGGVQELKRAVRLAKLFEPALGTLVGPSRIARFEGGSYDLRSPNAFCAPVSTLFSESLLDGLHTTAEFARVASAHESRYVTFNIQPLQSIHTVEVRMHSGTVEARKILPWLSLWMQILWAAANRSDIPRGSDRGVIEPDGDIVALALGYLPDARQLQQRNFVQRLAARRSEVVQQWARHPQLRPWLEYTTRWMPVPGLADET
jgi:superfamily II DNA or RNA helicase